MKPSQLFYAEELLRRLVKDDLVFEQSAPGRGFLGGDRVRARELLALTAGRAPFDDSAAIEAAAIVHRHSRRFKPVLIARLDGKLNPSATDNPPLEP